MSRDDLRKLGETVRVSDALRKLSGVVRPSDALRNLSIGGKQQPQRNGTPGRQAGAERATPMRAEEQTGGIRKAATKKRRPTRDKAASIAANSAPASIATDKHYRVKEIAEMWACSANTVRDQFENEPGVIRIGHPTGKRAYWTLLIPESVLLRVHARLSAKRSPSTSNKLAKSVPSLINPRRVMHLRNTYRTVTKKP